MKKNRYKEKHMNAPIEKQETASWANIEKLKNVSNVPIPNEFEVINAKDWVDENEK